MEEMNEFNFPKLTEKAEELEPGLFPALLGMANDGQAMCVAIDPNEDSEHLKWIRGVSHFPMNSKTTAKAKREGWNVIKIEKVHPDSIVWRLAIR